jgi:hypothetical protein
MDGNKNLKYFHFFCAALLLHNNIITKTTTVRIMLQNNKRKLNCVATPTYTGVLIMVKN